jgi:4,5-dihydroxyphthalate decarboxylase
MTTETKTLTLTTAIGEHKVYDALKSGDVSIPGVQFNFQDVKPTTAIFRKMSRTLDYDVCEMALVTYFCAREAGKPFTALPAFPWQNMQHGAMYYNANKISGPQDLNGKTATSRAYTVTPGVWMRGILKEDFGIDSKTMKFIIGDEEHVAEFHDHYPSNVERRLGAKLVEILESGEADAGIAGTPASDKDYIKPMYPDPQAACKDFYNRTGIFPLNHMVVIKDSVLQENPWFAEALYEALKKSKEATFKADPGAKIGGAGIVEGDPLPYGISANRLKIDTLLDMCAEQGVTQRRMTIEELWPLGLD